MIQARFAVGLTYLLLGLISAGTVEADDRLDAERIVDTSQTTFRDFVNDPDLGWFRDNVRNAKAILIIPTLIKGGFFFGGSGGNGVLLRQDTENGDWTYPAFYTLGSVTFGLQIGAETAQVILLVMTTRGVEQLLSTKVELGGDLSLAAGPFGDGAGAATADIIQFSRTKGVFGGLTLDGAVVAVRNALNTAYYGREIGPEEILLTQQAGNPQADPLRTEIATHTTD